MEVDEVAGGEAPRERGAPLGGLPKLRAAAAQPPVVRREPRLERSALWAFAYPLFYSFIKFKLVGAPTNTAIHPVDAIGGVCRGPLAETRAHVSKRANAKHFAPGGRRSGNVAHVHLSAAFVDPAQAHKLVGAVAREPVDVVVAPQRGQIDITNCNCTVCTSTNTS